MSRTLLMVAVMAVAQTAVAEETGPADTAKRSPAVAEQSVTPATPARPSIRVLRDPYDLASFYRSGGTAPGGWAGLPDDPSYRIAGFYRSQSGETDGSAYGWSRFWVAGYGAERPRPLPSYRRTIGENGDLFLVVPFLAPLGPISGAFFGY